MKRLLGLHKNRVLHGALILVGFSTLGLGSSPALAQESVSAEAEKSDVHPPELVTFVEAEYPLTALQARRDGAVTLRLTIDAEGRVTGAEVVHPAAHDLDEAARNAALKFRFEPARRGSKPVASRILYEYRFELPEGPYEAGKKQGGHASHRDAAVETPPDESVPERASADRAELGTQSPTASAPLAEDAPIEVTVLGAQPARSPGAVHVIDKQKLERYSYDDPLAIIQTAPGVYVRQEDGAGLRPNIGLRGAASDRSKKLTLMEDGVLFGPAPYSAPAAYYFPLMARMTQIRVVKGPAAIAYGPQTIGGAVDFMTRPIPSTTRGKLDVAGGEHGYGRAHIWAGTTSQDGKLGFLVEGIHLRSSGFKHLPGGEDTGFHRNEWVAKAAYLVDPNARSINEISLKASYSDELSNETYLGLSDEDFRRDPLQRYAASKRDRMQWHRTGIAVTHKARPLDELQIETTVYRNDLSRSWRKVNRFAGANLFDVLSQPETPTSAIFHAILRGELDSTAAPETLLIGPNARDFVSQGIQTRTRLDAETGPVTHRLEYGLRFHHDRIERRHSEDGFLVIGGDLVPTDAATTVTTSNEAWTQAVAIHASDAMTWRSLTLTPGVRMELMRSELTDRLAQTSQRGSAQVVLPGVGAFYGLTESLGVLSGVYRGFSPPPPGNPEHTGPELSVNYEAGVRYSDTPTRVELLGYYNDYSNLTDICTLSSGCLDAALDRQFNAGSARIYGGEAYAGHEFPMGSLKLPVSIAYTLTLTEFLDTFDSDDPIFGRVEAGDELPYVPRHQAHASIALEAKRASGYVSVTYVSSMREQAGSEPLDEALTTDEQIVFDAGASFHLLPSVELYANVRNLFDRHSLVSRRPYGARPNAPRWVQAGLKAQF